MLQEDTADAGRTLEGRVALVTGAGRGVGRAIAEALAGAGMVVAIVARSEGELNQTAALIGAAGGRALALPADVTDQEAVARVVEQTERELGPIDLLVNNAGRYSVIGPIWQVDPAEWWRDVQVNLQGVFLCSHAVLPGMIARRGGRIINLSSGVGTRPAPYTSNYGSAKAAVLHFTESLAVATGGHGIGVFAISPGVVHTTMTDHLVHSEAGRRWLPEYQSIPEERWQPPERAAHLVLALASGAADILSGRFIHVSDDLDEMVRRAGEIEHDDLYTLRLRRLPE